MLKYHGRNKQITLATRKVNSHEFREKLSEEIAKQEFDMSTASAEYLSENFKIFLINETVNVKTYYRYFSKALAYFTYSRPKDVNINTAKLNRTTGSIGATLIHEAAHMFDYEDKDHSMGHGDNSRIGKQNTFPYKVGNIASAIIDDDLPDYDNMENRNIKVSFSFWAWFKNLFT